LFSQSALTEWSLGKIRHLSGATQACSRSPTNVQNYHNKGRKLIARSILTSYTGIAYHVEHNAQGTGPHHGFNMLISVERTYVEEYYPSVRM